MKKFNILFLMTLLFVGVFATGFVLAYSGSGSDGNDGSSGDSNDNNSRESDLIGSSNRKIVNDEFIENKIDSSGKRTDVRTRFEEKRENGRIEGRFEEEIRFVDESGNIVRKRVRIEVKEEDGIIKRKIKVVTKTGNEIEVESKLEIREELEGNLSKVKIKKSNGNETELKVLPDRASEIAKEKLRARNISIEIREIEERNIPRVVYHASGDRPGKFLGIFKIKARYEASINPETGEVTNFRGPWWAFLVTSIDEQEQQDIPIDETNNSNVQETNMSN